MHLCPWSLALASNIPVLGLGLGFFCVSLALASSHVSSTPALVINRGGVESTTFEAKDTKKIRGQGPTSREQTLSRPRPRTKDTRRNCSPKKMVPKKFLQATSKKKRSSREKTPNFRKKSGVLQPKKR